VESAEYQRIFEHEGSHFWYRGLHALVLRTLQQQLRITGDGGAAAAAASAAATLTNATDATDATMERAEILDAGCGTGGLAAQMEALGRVTGVDWSPHALDFAARRGLSRLLRGSVSALPFRAASFDAVVSCDVLYHRAVPDDGAALAELARVCRPGGLVLLNLPAHAWMTGSHDRQVHTARRYTRPEVRRLAEASGLRVVRLAWFNCALLPAAAAVRVASRGGEQRRSDVRPLPALINAPLAAWMKVEARLAGRGMLPWGLSIFAVLRKPG